MTQAEFLALSRSTGRTQAWLAEHIGGVTLSTWLRWCGQKADVAGKQAPPAAIARLQAYASGHESLMACLPYPTKQKKP